MKSDVLKRLLFSIRPTRLLVGPDKFYQAVTISGSPVWPAFLKNVFIWMLKNKPPNHSTPLSFRFKNLDNRLQNFSKKIAQITISEINGFIRIYLRENDQELSNLFLNYLTSFIRNSMSITVLAKYNCEKSYASTMETKNCVGSRQIVHNSVSSFSRKRKNCFKSWQFHYSIPVKKRFEYWQINITSSSQNKKLSRFEYKLNIFLLDSYKISSEEE